MPDGFYDSPALRAALARHDFGMVFTAVRGATGMAQEQLAFLVEMDQSWVSKVERRERRLRDIGPIVRVATALGIPARLLGFGATGSVDDEQKVVSWVDRRDFISLVTGLTLGLATPAELERLESLLPAAGTDISRRIDISDVQVIEACTAAFRSQDYAFGGGWSRAAAIAQLRTVLPLRAADCAEEVHGRLLVAIAALAKLTGFMSFDVEDHDAARRLWLIALDTARHTSHPLGTDLTVAILGDMVDQAVHLDRPREALNLAQLGAVTVTNSEHPVSAGTRSYIASRLATSHAALGQVQPCQRALDRVLESSAEGDLATSPTWVHGMTAAQIAAFQGRSWSLLSLTNPDCTSPAIDHLRTAVDSFDSGYARSRAIQLPDLAGAYFRAGELDGAVTTGHDAVTAISGLSSKRAHARLRTLATTAQPYQDNPEVVDLRERIRHALATAA